MTGLHRFGSPVKPHDGEAEARIVRVEAQGSAVELPVGESIAALGASRVAHEVA
jgi:hypothetical protein